MRRTAYCSIIGLLYIDAGLALCIHVLIIIVTIIEHVSRKSSQISRLLADSSPGNFAVCVERYYF